MTADFGGFAWLRPILVGVRSEKFSGSDQSLLFLDPIGEFLFLTDWLTECLKMNFTIDFDNFAQLRSKSVGVWLEKNFGSGRSILLSDPIRKFQSPAD